MKLLTQYPRLIALIPFVLIFWTLLILYLTLMPSESLPAVKVFSYDKIGHFGMFGGWTGLVGMYFFYIRKNVSVNLVLIMIAGIFFGAAIEFLQLTLPINRAFSWYDIMANSLGAVVAWLVLRKMRTDLQKHP